MKSKLVFRILGALASALIIASVFIPFVSVTGYSQSLWETHNAVGTIYLPIMLIVFGVVGVLVFSTGFKTELAYASAGGLLFFLITQTIPIINQGTFNTLGVGYYCLAIGTLLIIIMAFICGLRVKQKVVKENVVEDTKQVSMIDQIDKLYNDQPENQNLNEINGIDNIIQPLPISEITQIPVQNNVQMENNPQVEMPISNNELSPLQNLNTLPNETLTNSQIVPTQLDNTIQNVNPVTEQPSINVPNIQENLTTPVIAEFSTPVMENLENTSATNPVIAEFNIPTQNVTSEGSIPNIQEGLINPVVSEFSTPVNSSFMSNNSFTEQQVNENINDVNASEEIKTLDSNNKFDVMGEPTNNASNLDIFG